MAKAWDWAVLAVTGTGVVWSFRQADWEDWWGTIEGLFRSRDLHLHPMAPGCCVASSVYDDDELEGLGPECGSFRISVQVAVDRLAALGSNVRDATTRVLHHLDRLGSSDGPVLRELREQVMAPTDLQMLSSLSEVLIESYGLANPLDVMAVLLAVTPPNEEVFYTSHRGEMEFQFTGEHDPLEWALRRGRISHSVVLTEGVFDREVLERAVASAYPHLQDYLRFIDRSHVVERSANALVTFVRTLLAAGVQNPNFIAVFDNDAEGAQAAARLAESPLPTGYRVCTLPDVAGLRSAPVLLLDQVELRDANGWGAAIEMYLALDLGQPLPTLTLSKMGRTYQGCWSSATRLRSRPQPAHVPTWSGTT